MPRTDSIFEKRKWLQDSKNGKSDERIAKERKRTIRTIRKGLNEARREESFSVAKIDLIKDKLRDHNNSLIRLLEETMISLDPPIPSQSVPLSEPLNSIEFDARGAKARYEGKYKARITEIALNTESNKLWDSLREHLKGDRFTKGVTLWKKSMISHLEARIVFKKKLLRLLTKKTGLTIEDASANEPFLYASCLDLLMLNAMQKLTGFAGGELSEDGFNINAKKGVVEHEDTPMAYTPNQEEKCKKSILSAFREALNSDEAIEVRESYRDLKTESTKVKSAGEEILLMGMVPGNCHICDRMGT
jgi:hypothetical protein